MDDDVSGQCGTPFAQEARAGSRLPAYCRIDHIETPALQFIFSTEHHTVTDRDCIDLGSGLRWDRNECAEGERHY
jgi:hypothetical protein